VKFGTLSASAMRFVLPLRNLLSGHSTHYQLRDDTIDPRLVQMVP